MKRFENETKFDIEIFSKVKQNGTFWKVKLIQTRKFRSTKIAFKSLNSGVNCHVRRKLAATCESFVTNMANIWLVSRVNPQMQSKSLLHWKLFSTQIAMINDVSSVL